MKRAVLLVALVVLVVGSAIPSGCAAVAGKAVVPPANAARRSAPASGKSNPMAPVQPISGDCTPETAVAWLTHFGDVMARLSTGGLPEMSKTAFKAVEMLGSQIVANQRLISDQRVLSKVVQITPSIWTAGFWYAPVDAWKPVFDKIFHPVATLCKTQPGYEQSYDALVNATSLMVRFTKDQVFFTGVDEGIELPTRNKGFMALLSELITCLSKTTGFQLDERKLRDYMNTIPSKRDGMDMSAAYPVYVDTAKYKESDAAALKKYLCGSPQQQSVRAIK
ncbi:hypothetical protein P43SY_003696 [Pythium insidiosum]|uniref:Uncharacterized protein n=1 Tax=Pythium insidiosum TaxID=114742 RepID=A0AAD5LG19_PYTIN|nr:hypothetical protein P43SY_003696 [Pythium insidiosum]